MRVLKRDLDLHRHCWSKNLKQFWKRTTRIIQSKDFCFVFVLRSLQLQYLIHDKLTSLGRLSVQQQTVRGNQRRRARHLKRPLGQVEDNYTFCTKMFHALPNPFTGGCLNDNFYFIVLFAMVNRVLHGPNCFHAEFSNLCTRRWREKQRKDKNYSARF